MELKNFPQELSLQQKNIVNSIATRNLRSLIRHIEFHFKFRDKYNTNFDIYQKLRSSYLEKVLDYLYKLSNKKLQEIAEIKNVGKMSAKNIKQSLELFFQRINYTLNCEE